MPNIFLPVGGLLLPPSSTIPTLPCGKRTAQKQAFALVNSLGSALFAHGLSDAVLWDYVKRSHKVESRSELSERDWVVLSARLFAVQKSLSADNEILFQKLVSEIRSVLGTCRAYRIRADGTFRKIYDGIITDDIAARCQSHADFSGCRVRLHGADREDGIIFFDPAEFAPDPNMPPCGGESEPARAFEVRQRGNETHHVEIPFPDVENIGSWGERWAEETGRTVHITDRMGHFVLMQFSPVRD